MEHIEQLAKQVIETYEEERRDADSNGDALFFILDEVSAANGLNEQEFDLLCREVYAQCKDM